MDDLEISLGSTSYCTPLLVESERIECEVVLKDIVLIDNGGRHPSKYNSW